MAETNEPLPGAASISHKLPELPKLPVDTPLNKQTISSTAMPPRQKYSMPLPIRTFPLPTFYPSNPVSLLHLALAWLGQVLAPPSSSPTAAAAVYEGVWSPATRSVRITDPKSMNDLWSQGFYGKGSLSRSEPSWMKREKARQEAGDAGASGQDTPSGGSMTKTSEQRTAQRREERADTKWERGRTELEAIEQRRREEQQREGGAGLARQDVVVLEEKENASANGHWHSSGPLSLPPKTVFKAPVGPLELLALPNSDADLKKALAAEATVVDGDPRGLGLQGLVIDSVLSCPSPPSPSPSIEPLKRQKSVRFSPTVESTTFLHSDPPSPNHSSLSLCKAATERGVPEIVNKEHLQLSTEEAFFLAYAVGALRVVDEATGAVLTTPQLLCLFRQYSYFPPRSPSSLSAGDPFLVHYAVYHHFRSLGWVPRHGIKFGVDWLLYGKGPALDHAEFGVMVMAAGEEGEEGEEGDEGRGLATKRSWHWLHSVNRVLSTVFKSMVLVYVEVPRAAAVGDGQDITALLRQYKIREVMVRRWSSNRNRD